MASWRANAAADRIAVRSAWMERVMSNRLAYATTTLGLELLLVRKELAHTDHAVAAELLRMAKTDTETQLKHLKKHIAKELAKPVTPIHVAFPHAAPSPRSRVVAMVGAGVREPGL